MEIARLSRYGLLSVTGEQAREFLHAQLTNDIANLPAGRAALAGWCSAKGRLLASFLVIPVAGGFLLQLSRDLAPAIAKRLAMFVLRSKVKVEDVSARAQLGVWGALPGASGDALAVSEVPGGIAVAMGADRFLVIGEVAGDEVPETRWALEEIRAGRPLITAATQDQFVPQMVNYDRIGAVSFQKGCYPGQEIVARAQYRGQVKRRMQKLEAPASAQLQPGQEYQGGTVVDAATTPQAVELLAVMPVDGA
ncbi:MAG TPA: folate-binding protein [Burkholderiales bacterium]|jgi:folate-binding protein YgfZ|nr:folate-binding protein [Burkholderiales bacterium]